MKSTGSSGLLATMSCSGMILCLFQVLQDEALGVQGCVAGFCCGSWGLLEGSGRGVLLVHTYTKHFGTRKAFRACLPVDGHKCKPDGGLGFQPRFCFLKG